MTSLLNISSTLFVKAKWKNKSRCTEQNNRSKYFRASIGFYISYESYSHGADKSSVGEANRSAWLRLFIKPTKKLSHSFWSEWQNKLASLGDALPVPLAFQIEDKWQSCKTWTTNLFVVISARKQDHGIVAVAIPVALAVHLRYQKLQRNLSAPIGVMGHCTHIARQLCGFFLRPMLLCHYAPPSATTVRCAHPHPQMSVL